MKRNIHYLSVEITPEFLVQEKPKEVLGVYKRASIGQCRKEMRGAARTSREYINEHISQPFSEINCRGGHVEGGGSLK